MSSSCEEKPAKTRQFHSCLSLRISKPWGQGQEAVQDDQKAPGERPSCWKEKRKNTSRGRSAAGRERWTVEPGRGEWNASREENASRGRPATGRETQVMDPVTTSRVRHRVRSPNDSRGDPVEKTPGSGSGSPNLLEGHTREDKSILTIKGEDQAALERPGTMMEKGGE
ncbi:hypothetical protein Y1Q_0012467 [Alligator mississippiensis]|nr:hypothetical protein Y1Q_0012467 [Alligator mississippiensis]